MSIQNFWQKNKGKLTGIGLAGPIGFSAGALYDLYNNKKSKAIDEIPVNSKVKTLPKATYNSNKARNNYNNAVMDLQAFKTRQSQTPKYNPLANINQLSDKAGVDKNGDKKESQLSKYLKEIQRIEAGKFTYSPTEKANLENIRSTGRQLELRQSRVNDNYMGGTLQGELRSGRSRYAQEIADDSLINAMQHGTEKINDIDLETSKSVAELENSIKEERLRQVAEKYGILQEQDKQRDDVTQNIQKNLIDYQKAMAMIDNYNRTNATKEYEFGLKNPGFSDYQRQQNINAQLRTRANSNSGGINFWAGL